MREQDDDEDGGEDGSGRRGPWRAVAGVLTVLLVLAGGGAYAAYRHLDANISSSDITGELGTARPTDTATTDQNILVLGSDTRAGTGTEYGAGLTTAQSDTMLVVHLAANRKWAAVVSVPRDSWVTIAACADGNGTTSAPHDFKINQAFTLGTERGSVADGAACSIRTVEADTGIRIDHFMVVDFTGFKAMTTALGGVPVCTTAPVDDPKSDLHLPAGRSIVSGEQALGFVRARYTIGDGSDLGRISRQQQFLASMARTARGKLTDPPAIYAFLDAATKSVTTDSGLGSLGALYDLASSVESLPTDRLEFFTVPTHPRSDVVASDRANVLWSEPAASTLFGQLSRDVDPAAAAAQTAASPAPPVVELPVTVVNAGGVTGRAAAVADQLRARGYTVPTVSTGALQAASGVRVPLTAKASGDALAAQVQGAPVVTSTGSTTGQLVLVIGRDWKGLADATATPAAGAGAGGAAPAPALTGATDACTKT